jgi:hypothetical protein
MARAAWNPFLDVTVTEDLTLFYLVPRNWKRHKLLKHEGPVTTML